MSRLHAWSLTHPSPYKPSASTPTYGWGEKDNGKRWAITMLCDDCFAIIHRDERSTFYCDKCLDKREARK